MFTSARGGIIGPDAAHDVVEGVEPREHVGDGYPGPTGAAYRGSAGDAYPGPTGDAYRGPTGDANRGSTGDAYRGPTGERLHARWLDLPANRSARRPGLTVVRNVVPNVPPTDDPSPPGDP